MQKNNLPFTSPALEHQQTSTTERCEDMTDTTQNVHISKASEKKSDTLWGDTGRHFEERAQEKGRE